MVAERFCLLPVRCSAASGLRSAGPLTPAEQRVLEFLCAGYSNKEIAAALDRAEPTIKNQVRACLRKYGVPSRARLVAQFHAAENSAGLVHRSC